MDQHEKAQDQEQITNNSINKAVLQLLSEFEKKHSLKIVFAAETGSRGQGFHTEQSDLDIKGFYTYSEEQYLGVADFPESYLSESFVINVDDKEIEVDFSLMEFRYYAEQRLLLQYEKQNIIFASSKQYINVFPKELFDKFVYHTIKSPKKAFFSDLETFISRRIYKPDVEYRKILNTLQCLLSLIHFTNSDTLNQYSYNLWEEIELNPYLDSKTKSDIKSFAELSLEKKNFSRKATIKRNGLPKWFTEMLDNFNSQRDETIIIEEKPEFRDLAQELHLYAMKLK